MSWSWDNHSCFLTLEGPCTLEEVLPQTLYQLAVSARTTVCTYSIYKEAPEDGPLRSETCRADTLSINKQSVQLHCVSRWNVYILHSCFITGIAPGSNGVQRLDDLEVLLLSKQIFLRPEFLPTPHNSRSHTVGSFQSLLRPPHVAAGWVGYVNRSEPKGSENRQLSNNMYLYHSTPHNPYCSNRAIT